MVGKEILGYHVDEKIGSGGFGTVYKVSKTNAAGTYVRALKHITLPTKKQYASVLNSMGGDYAKADGYFAGVLSDIVNEIRILSTLSESGIQNIVRYYENDIIETASPRSYDIYILMEFLTPLPDYFDERSFTVRDVIRLGKDILSALVSCHGKNIIHRDIKDDNIFVSPDGVYKLGDFGVSKALKDKSRAESVKGTPNFIAPEVYLGKSEYDNTVDIYSLGIVLYKFLNKSRNPFMPEFPSPYTTDDENAAFEARMKGDVPSLPHDAHNALGEAVLKAIMPRAERYNSAKEFLTALEEAERTLTTSELDLTVNVVVAAQREKTVEKMETRNNHMDETVGTDITAGADVTMSAPSDRNLFETFAAPATPPNQTPVIPTPPPTAQPSYNPAQGQSYAPQQPNYAPQQPNYAPQQPNYAPQQPGYPPQQGYAPTPGYPPQQGYTPAPGYPPQQGYAPAPGYPPQQGYGYQEPPKVAAIEKKDFSWLLYLLPLFIIAVYVIVYLVVIPEVYGNAVTVLEWLFTNPKQIVEHISEPSNVLKPIGSIILLKIFNWVLWIAFIASLYFIGRKLHFSQPKISESAQLVGKEAYVTSMEILEQIKLVSSQDVSRAKQAVYSVCERLKHETEFGSGSASVINCENEIAACLRAIEASIPGLYNAETVEGATQNIEMLSQKILGKIKVRIELKKK